MPAEVEDPICRRHAPIEELGVAADQVRQGGRPLHPITPRHPCVVDIPRWHRGVHGNAGGDDQIVIQEARCLQDPVCGRFIPGESIIAMEGLCRVRGHKR